jgi:hypothetical protein
MKHYLGQLPEKIWKEVYKNLFGDYTQSQFKFITHEQLLNNILYSSEFTCLKPKDALRCCAAAEGRKKNFFYNATPAEREAFHDQIKKKKQK